MGSIELNVKDAEGWQGGRNDAYMRNVEGKLAALDAASIADRAIKHAQPGPTERMRDAAAGRVGQIADAVQRVGDRLRQNENDAREAWEVLGESVGKRYLIVNEARDRVDLYERGAKTPSITIDKHRISTPHDIGAAVQDAVKLAIDRGWTSLKVEGSQEFRDAVWLEAKKYDLKVGHKPSPIVRAEFEQWRETNELRPLPSSSADKPVTRPGVTAPAAPTEPAKRDLAREFLSKTGEERLRDPALRNAELTAQEARKLATDKFEANDPKLKVAFASVDKTVSDQLARGHQFSTPKDVTQQIKTPKPDNRQQFERPRI